MPIFKSKEAKEAERKAIEAERVAIEAEKEVERRMLIKQANKKLESQISALKGKEKDFMEAAKEAIKNNFPPNLAISCLKTTINFRRKAQEMLMHQKTLEMVRDINQMVADFFTNMDEVTKGMGNMIDAQKAREVNKNLSKGLEWAAWNIEQLDELMGASENAISDFSGNLNGATDNEIEEWIYAQVDAEKKAGKEITDADIASLKSMIDAEEGKDI